MGKDKGFVAFRSVFVVTAAYLELSLDVVLSLGETSVSGNSGLVGEVSGRTMCGCRLDASGGD